jgi:diacylglycerol kinase (ATP)
LSNKTYVIVNPAAGRGAARARIPEVRASFAALGVSQFEETRFAGDEERLAALAIEHGAETIVAVGGDGTYARIAGAILARDQPCRLAVVPCGTGNDFAKTLGVEKLSLDQIAGLVSSHSQTSIDVGRVDELYFLNSCGFGFDASVLESSQSVRFLKGDAVYIYSALAQLFTYRGVSVSVGSGTGADKVLMLTVSNGRFLGGAFRIAPHASVLDGKLDVGVFGNTGVIGRVRVFAGAFRGTHLGLASVSSQRVSSIGLRFADPPLMEVDGELRQARSSTVNIECLPRALSVIAAPGYPL